MPSPRKKYVVGRLPINDGWLTTNCVINVMISPQAVIIVKLIYQNLCRCRSVRREQLP